MSENSVSEETKLQIFYFKTQILTFFYVRFGDSEGKPNPKIPFN